MERMEGERNVYKVFVGKPEGRRALERPRQRWEDGIGMDIRETGWWCLECTQLRIGTGGRLL
jgi:hypothetical protein